MTKLSDIGAITSINANSLIYAAQESGGNYTSAKMTAANLFANPQPIGATTPNTGVFTDLEADGISFDGGSNILSAYSQGTFSLTPYGSTTAGSPTLSTNLNRYTIIGKLCFINGYLLFTSKGGMAGNLLFSGLPFASVNNGGARVVTHMGIQSSNYDISGIAGAIGFGGYVINNTTVINMRVMTTTGGSTVMPVTAIADNFSLYYNMIIELP